MLLLKATVAEVMELLSGREQIVRAVWLEVASYIVMRREAPETNWQLL